MPLDPSIPLSVRTPQIDFLKPFQEAQQFRLGSEQLSAAEMENQQRRMDLEDQTTIQKVLPSLLQQNTDATGKVDFDKTINGLLGQVRPNTAFKLYNLLLGNAEKHATIAKTTQETAESESETQKVLTDYVGHRALGFKNANINPDGTFNATLLPAWAADVVQNHPKAKDLITGMLARIQQDPTQLPYEFNALIAGSKEATDAQLAQKKETREQTTAEALLPGERARSKLAELELKGQAPAQIPVIREATLRGDLLQKKLDMLKDANLPTLLKLADDVAPATDRANQALNFRTKARVSALWSMGDVEGAKKAIADAAGEVRALEIALDPRVQANKVALTIQNVQARQDAAMQGLGTVDQPSTTAQMVANYQESLPNALSRMPAQAREGLIAQVKAINPQFQQQYYQAFQKTENDAVTGELAKSSRALNTMMGHLGTLNLAADALKNGDIQVLNRIANAWGAAIGKTPKTTYETIVHRLGPEVTKAYVAGGGTSGERGTNEQDFSPSLGADQIKQNIGISAYLADSLIKANQKQYDRGTYGRGQQKLMTDEAEQIRQRLVQQVPANLQGHGAGGTAPLPATLSPSDVGKVYQNRAGKRIKILEVNPQNPKQFRSQEVQ